MNSDSIGICLRLEEVNWEQFATRSKIVAIVDDLYMSEFEAMCIFDDNSQKRRPWYSNDLIMYEARCGKDENTSYHHNWFYMKEMRRKYYE